MVDVSKALVEVITHAGQALVVSPLKIRQALVVDQKAHENRQRRQSGSDSRNDQLEVGIHRADVSIYFLVRRQLEGREFGPATLLRGRFRVRGVDVSPRASDDTWPFLLCQPDFGHDTILWSDAARQAASSCKVFS